MSKKKEKIGTTFHYISLIELDKRKSAKIREKLELFYKNCGCNGGKMNSSLPEQRKKNDIYDPVAEQMIDTIKED